MLHSQAHNGFFHGTPLAKDVFENECAECTPFWPGGGQGAGLYNVAISGSGWHEHSVSRCPPCGRGLEWRRLVGQDSDFGWLVDLTLVACRDVFFDVEGDRGPPKAIEEGA